MDGTIYRGNTLFEATNPFLSLLRELHIGYTFLTNNSSRSHKDYLEHLKQLGIHASENQLYTSSQATLKYLAEHWPNVRRLFVLGTPSLRQEMAAAGFVVTDDSATEEPDAVVVGFDTGLTFARLCRAAYWLKPPCSWIAARSAPRSSKPPAARRTPCWASLTRA